MDRDVIEAKVDEVLNARQTASAKPSSGQKTASSFFQSGAANGQANPFAAFASMHSAQGGYMPFRMRLFAKLATFATHPFLRRFLSKKWWPLWLVVGVLFSGFILIFLVLFLIWKGVHTLLRPYLDLFKKRG